MTAVSKKITVSWERRLENGIFNCQDQKRSDPKLQIDSVTVSNERVSVTTDRNISELIKLLRFCLLT